MTHSDEHLQGNKCGQRVHCGDTLRHTTALKTRFIFLFLGGGCKGGGQVRRDECDWSTWCEIHKAAFKQLTTTKGKIENTFSLRKIYSSLYSPGYHGTLFKAGWPRSACSCLPLAEIKGMWHHHQALNNIFEKLYLRFSANAPTQRGASTHKQTPNSKNWTN